MQKQLTLEASTFINFRDYTFQDPGSHGFRWVDIKRLRLAAGPFGGREPLAALIGHEQFRNDYAGGGVLAEGSRHGPYWLSQVTPDVYEAVSREESAHPPALGEAVRGRARQAAGGPAAEGVRLLGRGRPESNT